MIDVDVSPPTASRAEAKNNTLMLTVDVDDISHHGNHTITTPSDLLVRDRPRGPVVILLTVLGVTVDLQLNIKANFNIKMTPSVHVISTTMRRMSVNG